MENLYLEKIEIILKQFKEGIFHSTKENNGVVGEYLNVDISNQSPRLLCQSRSIFFLIKYYDIYGDEDALKLAESVYQKSRELYVLNQDWLMRSDNKTELLDLYGYASLSYAESLLFKASEAPQIGDYAKETLHLLASKILNKDFCVGDSIYQNKVSQNPLMHLFESFIFGYDLFKVDDFKSAALHILSMIYESFYDQNTGAIVEVVPEQDQQAWYEPGHLFEWGSLLKSAEDFGISHEFIEYSNLVRLAESHIVGEAFNVPARVNIVDNTIDEQFRIWTSLERIRVYFLFENFELAISGLDSLIKSFFDLNNCPKEYLNENECQVKATTGYHIINCFDEAVSYLLSNATS